MLGNLQRLLLAGSFVTAIAIAGLVVACDNKPRSFAGPSPSPPPYAVGIEIEGPRSIPPAQSVRFSATLRMSDGSSQAAGNVRWSTHYRLIQIDASGLATAGDRTGEDIVSAEVTATALVAPLRRTREVLILPDGTFRVVGVATEDVPPGVPLSGARIEVTNTTLAVTTDWDGRYALYGVPGRADIRVTKEGYQPAVQSLQLADHVTQNFRLAPIGVRLNLAGAYILTIDAACATSTPVSEDLRHRRYEAFVTQNGPALEVTLTESSRFKVNRVGRGDRFIGWADAVGARFDLGDNFYQYYAGPYDPATYPRIVERISDDTLLVLDGRATTGASPTGLSGDLQGFFINYTSPFPAFPQRSLGTCYSGAHRFTLTRR